VSAPHDRDQAIDRLLRQSLSTPAPEATASCVDPETLAAWAEGGLSGHELERAQSHVADCAHCQNVLAVLVHASADGLTTASSKTAMAERAPTRWLAWLVPLTAAAAAAAIWVAIPHGPSPEPQPSAGGQTQLAQAKAPEAPPPGAPEQTADAKELQAPAPAAKSDQPSRDQAQAELKKDADRRELDRLKQESQPADTGAADRADKLQATNERGAVAPATPAAAPSPAAAAAALPQPPREAFQERSANSAAQKAVPSGAVASLALTNRWRISGTTLQRSTNGGSTWSPVSTGVTTELTAVSSPSNTVCWVVGRGGVVLRTTDGQSFSRIAFPESTDLSAVQATDAQSATVTARDGRVLTTADGGATWR
jgi:photosynthesis system II assembly factor YCF48-like protein